ncbi:MAG: aldo/keto reductase [Planctomycetota bacterium]
MHYTRLGDTGLEVSEICLGCMSYGDPGWRPWVLDKEAAGPFFRRAIELGINFFDTANMYSNGVSEEVTGYWLRELGNLDELVIATKVYFPTGKGPNSRGLSRKHIQQACEASLRRLGVETIDLYQVHRFDPETPIDETLEALDQLVTQGKVRYLGASSTFAWKLAQALSISDNRGLSRFVSMQNHYNLLYREEEREMLPLCEDEGLGVIPWSPLARGLLAGGRTAPDDAKSTKRAESDDFARRLYDHPSDFEVMKANEELAQEIGVHPVQTALAWLLAQPAVTAPIIGATKLEHLDIAAASVELELRDEDIERLTSPYQPHAVRGHE